MNRETYINLVKDVMNKIIKTLPSKKYKELIDLCRKAIGKDPLINCIRAS